MSKDNPKLNLPNRLTLARLIMVPFCIAAVLLPASLVPETVSRLIAFALFVAASFTDCLDGKLQESAGSSPISASSSTPSPTNLW